MTEMGKYYKKDQQMFRQINKNNIFIVDVDESSTIKEEDDGFEIVPKKKFKKKHEKPEKPEINRRARLIVRNISYKETDEKLKTFFEKFGEVVEVKVLKRADGRLVGCAFVQFDKVNDAAKAIAQVSGKLVSGRVVQIDWAVGKSVYLKHLEDGKKVKTEGEIKVEDEKPDIVEVKVESEDEEEEDDDEEDDDDDDDQDEDMSEDEDEEEIDDKKNIKKQESNDIQEGRTVFIKNIPFTATDEDLKQSCLPFGKLYYALVIKDPISGHAKGTGFVKFLTKESADLCLQAGTEFKLLDAVLDPHPAMTRNDIKTKHEQSKKKEVADSRNLYLIKEGVILAGSPASVGVTAGDMKKRLDLESIKQQMLKNLNRFVSQDRLSIHNLPQAIDNDKLRKMVEDRTKLKPKECRVLRENKPSMGFPQGKSKGFGFISFPTHEDALKCLRKLNNNPDCFGKNNRPIVSFSIEDKSVANIKAKRLEKSIANNPTANKTTARKRPNRQERRQKKREANGQTTVPDDTNTFSGTASQPGSFVKSRPRWKIKEQAQEHFKNLSSEKKSAKKLKEKIQIRREKMQVDRPKQIKKKEKPDNFSVLVDKYRNMLDSSDAKDMKKKKKKWFS